MLNIKNLSVMKLSVIILFIKLIYYDAMLYIRNTSIWYGVFITNFK